MQTIPPTSGTVQAILFVQNPAKVAIRWIYRANWTAAASVDGDVLRACRAWRSSALAEPPLRTRLMILFFCVMHFRKLPFISKSGKGLGTCRLVSTSLIQYTARCHSVACGTDVAHLADYI